MELLFNIVTMSFDSFDPPYILNPKIPVQGKWIDLALLLVVAHIYAT